MSIGATVRRMFGRHERLVSELWRSAFIDLDHFVERVAGWAPNPKSILEIGCGEGAGTERLAAAFPNAAILSIDIAPNLGRLYRGPTDRVRFQQVAVTDLATAEAGQFDLVIMCDVLHHIPPQLRSDILASARSLLAPGGKFVFKDWARTATPIHWIAYAADRWLTGDKVQYVTAKEAEEYFAQPSTGVTLKGRAAIRPWRNNFALLMEPVG